MSGQQPPPYGNGPRGWNPRAHNPASPSPSSFLYRPPSPWTTAPSPPPIISGPRPYGHAMSPAPINQVRVSAAVPIYPIRGPSGQVVTNHRRHTSSQHQVLVVHTTAEWRPVVAHRRHRVPIGQLPCSTRTRMAPSRLAPSSCRRRHRPSFAKLQVRTSTTAIDRRHCRTTSTNSNHRNSISSRERQ